jgi:tetratricopeptide (TPR) repeat protein
MRRFEPWQVISGVAILALFGFFLYLELSRQPESSGTVMSGPPPVMQPQMAPALDVTPFERAVESNPNDPAALLALANVLHDNGGFSRAIETYKKYLKIKPDDPNARVDMGICYYQLGGQDSIHANMLMATAIQEMEIALKGSPRHQPAAFNLGVVTLTLGDLEKSRAWFRKAVELDKSSELGMRAQKMLDQHAFTP